MENSINYHIYITVNNTFVINTDKFDIFFKHLIKIAAAKNRKVRIILFPSILDRKRASNYPNNSNIESKSLLSLVTYETFQSAVKPST
mgnify:CR=1 FL=1